jgi:hypothetical protein
VTITLRVAAREDARAAILRDRELARTCDLTRPVIELDAADPGFDRILEQTKGTSGLWLNPIMAFTAKEMTQPRYFQLEGRKLVREIGPDYDLNRARLNATPFRKVDGRPLRIKLIDRIALSRIPLAPNMVGLASDWMAEFVLGRAFARTLEREGFSGYSLRPVFNPKTGQDHADYFQLYSESILPAAELDATTISLAADIPEEGGWRELGCLTYDVSDGHTFADVNRTAENWSNSFIPFWVVSQRVRAACLRDKLKGWAFRPVLEKGTPLHREYLETWASLLARVAVNPRNRW